MLQAHQSGSKGQRAARSSKHPGPTASGGGGDDYYKERQSQLFETKSNTFGQRVGGSRTMSQQQQQQQQQSGSNQTRQYAGPGRGREQQPRMPGGPRPPPKQKPFRNNGLETVKDMMDGISNLIMDRSTNEEERITKVLLSDARRFLVADPGVVDVLGGGGKITLGKTYSRSYTSTMVNDMTRSRVQISFPIAGGNGISGQGTLVANQDGITRLEVDVGGRVIDVPVVRNSQQ